MARPTSSLGTPTPIPSGSTGCWATRPLAKVRSVSPVRRRRMGSLSHWDTAWPLGPETVTGPASMIRACRCPPRLAGRRRTTGGLSDWDEGPGSGGDGAASRRAMLRPIFQVSRAAEEQVLHCFSGLRAKFAKFSFQKYSQRPTITRRGPSHSQRPAFTLAPWPSESLRLAQPVELTVTRVTRHAQRPARLTRPGSSHSQRPAVTRRGPPSTPAGRQSSRTAAGRHLPLGSGPRYQILS